MRVGLIGCGYAAGLHMLAYKRLKNVKVEAVADIDINKARIFARKYDIPKVFVNYFDVLDLRDIDLIDVCTPTSTHADIVCNVAKYGFDVLLEKPMARTSSECDRIISEFRRNGVKLCVCHNRLFNPEIQKAKSNIDYHLVRTKYLTNVGIDWKHWSSQKEEGGMLWESGTHSAYLQKYFLGDIEEVYAIGSKLGTPIFYEIAAFLRSSSNTYGIMELSWVSELSEDSLKLYGLNGIKTIDTSYFPKLSFFDTYKNSILSSIKELIKIRIIGSYIKEARSFHFELINNYIESLKNDAPLPVQPDEGKDAIKLLEAIERSLESGEIVHL